MGKKIEREDPSQKILMTAYECLSTRGYANVSMRDIADEACVALSQLNYYYKNKEGLFIKVINMMIHQYLHEIEGNLKSAAGTKEKVSSLICFFKELLKNKPALLRLFIDFTAQSLWIPSFREQVEGLFNSLTEMIEINLLTDTESCKGLQGYSPKSIARYILGALYGTSIQILLGTDRDSAIDSLNMAESILN